MLRVIQCYFLQINLYATITATLLPYCLPYSLTTLAWQVNHYQYHAIMLGSTYKRYDMAVTILRIRIYAGLLGWVSAEPPSVLLCGRVCENLTSYSSSRPICPITEMLWGNPPL